MAILAVSYGNRKGEPRLGSVQSRAHEVLKDAPVLEAEEIVFSYDRKPVLRELSMRIFQGEFVGIIGPNGAGKSTLLNLLNGLLLPRKGRILLHQKDLRSYTSNDIARHIATVPQFADIVFPYRVMEIVLMGRHPWLGRFAFEAASDITIAREAIEATDVAQFADRFFAELSGGEKQGVIIARALAQDTPILLLDEPTSSLDLKHQVFIYRLLERMRHEQRKTIVVVSHDINLAALFCERLVLIKDGAVMKEGTPGEIISRELIRQAYETEVEILTDEQGMPFVRLLK
jgi:iron complex transport system ATP-binding protein